MDEHTLKNMLEISVSDFNRQKTSTLHLKEAKAWFKKFTGKEYTSDPNDLIAIYCSLKEIA